MKVFNLLLFMFSLLTSATVFADTSAFSLITPNSDLTGFPSPYATVTVTTSGPNSNTATVMFSSDSTGGFLYLIGATNAADVNVNATSFTPSNAITTSLPGFTPPSISFDNNRNVSSFGSFNLNLIFSDGFTNSVNSVTFNLTDNSGTWASAANVLTDNNSGNLAAMHALVCSSSSCTVGGGAITTGFVSGQQVATPEPGTWLLMGSSLMGMYALTALKKRRVNVI
ncbi:MAG TPA: PEP-CTERM sorting domain-containing protein [Waddliaceae bacterium]